MLIVEVGIKLDKDFEYYDSLLKKWFNKRF